MFRIIVVLVTFSIFTTYAFANISAYDPEPTEMPTRSPYPQSSSSLFSSNSETESSTPTFTQSANSSYTSARTSSISYSASPTPTSFPMPENNGLSTGAKAGIITGSLAAVAAAFGIIGYTIKKGFCCCVVSSVVQQTASGNRIMQTLFETKGEKANRLYTEMENRNLAP